MAGCVPDFLVSCNWFSQEAVLKKYPPKAGRKFKME